MEILVTANHCSARDVASELALACFCIPLNLEDFSLVALATDAQVKLSRERRMIERSRQKSWKNVFWLTYAASSDNTLQPLR